jgi:hypothetical protein
MHGIVRGWIVQVIQEHATLLALAVRQRAKFEGWLKFELAAYAMQMGAQRVEVERGRRDDDADTSRSDVSFIYEGTRYDIELKTPNTNWRMPGVLSAGRPITKNVADIIADGRKLARSVGQGLLAFVMFPVPPRDRRWTHYLDRIAEHLSIPLSEFQHAARVNILLGDGNTSDLIVVAFPVPHA